jgi:putative acetyltransferase
MAGFDYPDAVDLNLVGTYPAFTKAGGGYVWDAVLEYRVWLHSELGAPDIEDANDYFYAFGTYAAALAFSQQTRGAEPPLALVQQLEHINEPEPGVYVHVKEPRITEWQVEWLRRPKRTASTIPAFFAPDAPVNRLDILRGLG